MPPLAAPRQRRWQTGAFDYSATSATTYCGRDCDCPLCHPSTYLIISNQPANTQAVILLAKNDLPERKKYPLASLK